MRTKQSIEIRNLIVFRSFSNFYHKFLEKKSKNFVQTRKHVLKVIKSKSFPFLLFPFKPQTFIFQFKLIKTVRLKYKISFSGELEFMIRLLIKFYCEILFTINFGCKIYPQKCLIYKLHTKRI